MPETRNQTYSHIQLELTNENWFTNRHFSSTEFPSPMVGSHHSPHRESCFFSWIRRIMDFDDLDGLRVDEKGQGFESKGFIFRTWPTWCEFESKDLAGRFLKHQPVKQIGEFKTFCEANFYPLVN